MVKKGVRLKMGEKSIYFRNEKPVFKEHLSEKENAYIYIYI